jgi:WD40 repeat protein
VYPERHVMLKQKRDEQPSEQPERELPPGVKLLRILEGHKDHVVSVVFDPMGRTLASGGYDNTVKLWEVAIGKLLRTLEGHEGDVWSVVSDDQGSTSHHGQGRVGGRFGRGQNGVGLAVSSRRI